MPFNEKTSTNPSPIYACIDLGSNSFHLLIATFVDNQLHILKRYSQKIQLGRGVIRDGKITDESMIKGLDCLKVFQSEINQYPNCRQRTYGTQALRKAINADVFIQEAHKIGFSIQVIDGYQEAVWIYQGITRPLNAQSQDKTILTIDIGGGSTEFSWGKGTHMHNAVSLPMGCVSWSELYFPQGKISHSAWDQAYQASVNLLHEHQALFTLKPDQIYASSGSAKLIKNLCLSHNSIDEAIHRVDLENLKTQSMAFSNACDLDFKQLKASRRDLLLPGMSIMLAIMKQLSIEHIEFSKHALREGILFKWHDDTVSSV